MEKKDVTYEKAEIRDYGDLRELTAQQATGTHTDVPKGFPAGPGDPVFS